MQNFRRALRLALAYRWTLACALLTAVVVALLWGANIGGLYPIVQVVFRGQSLQKWIADDIADANRSIGELDKSIATLQQQVQQAPAGRDRALRLELAAAEARRSDQQTFLLRRQQLKPYIDRYLPDDPFRTLVLIVGVLLLATIVKDLCLFANGMLVDRVTFLAAMDLRKEFYRRTLRLDLKLFHDTKTSEMMSRFTNDLDSIGGGIQCVLGRAVLEPLKLITCIVGAAFICWRLLLFTMIIFPLAAYLVSRLSKSLKRANRRAMEGVSQIYSILQETFGGIKVVKAFTMERYERHRLHEATKQLFRKAMKISRYDSLAHPAVEIFGIAIVCLGIVSGAYLVLNQETHLLGIRMSDRPLSLPGLLVFYGMLVGASDPARKLSEVFNRLQRGAAAADRVYQLYDREPTICDPVKPRALHRHCHELTFDGVDFCYSSDHVIMRGIDLRIPFGETLAIVGPNGCGKTTLANLLPRFYDPTAGAVKLDGIDLRDVRLNDLRRQIGLVTQEPLLFDDTVFNNIRYGAPDATPEQVIAAAKQAHAHRFIETRLEKGYETKVGQLGNRLSGGERQRIALARAILRDPAILILDEATSQIDLESEQLIHETLEHFARDRTTVLITHRLAILGLADRIVVMQAGQIVDVGSHSELMGRCETYRRLHQIQFRESA